MKQLILLFLLSITSVISHAQTKISLSDISKHIGDSVALNAQVFGVKYLPDSKGAPTFINLGAAYPNQLLTAVIWKDVRTQMAIQPTEENLKNKTVIVIGKLELYRSKPQIVIKHLSQFQVIDNNGEVLPF
jgi:hypothetical protein